MSLFHVARQSAINLLAETGTRDAASFSDSRLARRLEILGENAGSRARTVYSTRLLGHLRMALQRRDTVKVVPGPVRAVQTPPAKPQEQEKAFTRAAVYGLELVKKELQMSTSGRPSTKKELLRLLMTELEIKPDQALETLVQSLRWLKKRMVVLGDKHRGWWIAGNAGRI